MRSSSVLCLNNQGVHRMAYREWGAQDNERVIVCVHGLARNGRDFDDIAKALSREYRVICPDIVGRGESDWLTDPVGYAIPQYINDLFVLLARLNIKQVDWLGTSMGGILGMVLASYDNTPVRRLILNDIGAFVAKESLQRIGDYLKPHYFEDLLAAERFMKLTYPGLKNLSDEQWRHLSKHGFRETEQGWTQHYDPAIGDITRANSALDVDLWPFWNKVKCPQLLIWGEDSDVLSRETVEQMQAKNPSMDLYSLPGIPHVPSLMESDQIQFVLDWLRSHSVNSNGSIGESV